MNTIAKISPIICLLIFLFLLPGVLGQLEEEGDDPEFLGFEIEKLLSLINGLLALALFIITFVTYRREYRLRLLYVSIAFLLFSIRSFLKAHELFIEEIGWIDPITVFLDFIVLLVFFYGIFKK